MFKYSKNKSKKRLWNIPAATVLWIFCISKLCDSYSYSQWAFWLRQHCILGLFAVAMHTPYTRHLSVSVRIQYVASDNSGSHYEAISVMLYTLETSSTIQHNICAPEDEKNINKRATEHELYIYSPHCAVSVCVLSQLFYLNAVSNQLFSSLIWLLLAGSFISIFIYEVATLSAIRWESCLEAMHVFMKISKFAANVLINLYKLSPVLPVCNSPIWILVTDRCGDTGSCS